MWRRGAVSLGGGGGGGGGGGTFVWRPDGEDEGGYEDGGGNEGGAYEGGAYEGGAYEGGGYEGEGAYEVPRSGSSHSSEAAITVLQELAQEAVALANGPFNGTIGRFMP